MGTGKWKINRKNYYHQKMGFEKSAMVINHSTQEVLIANYTYSLQLFGKIRDVFPDWKIKDDVFIMPTSQSEIYYYEDSGYCIKVVD
jgi:hypothetical protein